MHRFRAFALACGFWVVMSSVAAQAQSSDGASVGPLTFATVERAPFSVLGASGPEGFSIELMRAIGKEIGRPMQFEMMERFSDMFGAIDTGRVHGAVANISITAAREEALDFSHPIFEAGLQIMVPPTGAATGSLFSALVNWDIAFAVLAAAALLFGGGLMMWLFERKRQVYFDRPLGDAMFPSFWWALNLVVNGGFEERVPQSRGGRFFAVILVISSLFIVSIFVARITAAMTVAAISGNIDSLADLDGRRVGTMAGSTAATFLAQRDMGFHGYDNLDLMLSEFESGDLDAVMFDGPILAWYINNQGVGHGRLLPRVFKPENYGVALPTDSALTEDINRALLALRENGQYDQLRRKHFGAMR